MEFIRVKIQTCLQCWTAANQIATKKKRLATTVALCSLLSSSTNTSPGLNKIPDTLNQMLLMRADMLQVASSHACSMHVIVVQCGLLLYAPFSV